MTDPRRTAYLVTLPATVRGAVERAFVGTASPRAAIKAHCLLCSHFDRAEISDCRVLTCALWSYRPFQKARNGPGVASLAHSRAITVPEGVQTSPDEETR